jgi:trehalose utilization protein
MRTPLFIFLLLYSSSLLAAPIRVLVWDEQSPAAKKAYTNSIGDHIAAYLGTLPDLSVKSVCLADPEQGLSDETITNTDVLIWWSHTKNKLVPDEKAKQIVARIKDGSLSLIVLHSALTSKVFIESMNERAREDAAKVIPPGVPTEFLLPKAYKDPLPTDPITPRVEMVTNWPAHQTLALVYLPICEIIGFREDGKPSHVTTMLPDHPIAHDVPKEFDIAQTEVYLEPFHVPPPDAVIFHEKYASGEEFRTGMLWTVGKGKVFYFRPEHETFRGYDNPAILKIIGNAAEWMGKSRY